VRRQQFLSKFALLNHEFEINVHILAALGIENLPLLLFTFGLLHLQSTLLSVLFDLFDLLQMGVLLIAASHSNLDY
jgi:hypothetical protein